MDNLSLGIWLGNSEQKAIYCGQNLAIDINLLAFRTFKPK